MRTRTSVILLLAAALPLAAQTTTPVSSPAKADLEKAIAKGIEFLKSKQAENGSWGDVTLPGLTALPLRAAAGDPARQQGQALPDWAKKGFAYLVSTQKEDGGLYTKGLGTYNTSIGLMALLASGDPAYDEAARKARRYLATQQMDVDEKGKTDNAMDGGIGYGASGKVHCDLSNTVMVLEALRAADKKFSDEGTSKGPDLDWEAAKTFISRCQNLKPSNDQPWASDDPEERGGFVYSPLESKAGDKETAPGQKTYQSYGSMSYAGLLSLIYAEVEAKDPRVVAAKEWLEKHYTLKENPRMGAQGLYYYYHTMAKALSAAGLKTLKTPQGEVDWKSELARQVLSLQRPDGSWVNEAANRWMENDPVLVTSYSVLVLEQIHRGL